MTKYVHIVFIDGDEYSDDVEPLLYPEIDGMQFVTAESIAATINHLAQWDHGDDGDVRESEPWGSRDDVVPSDDGRYILSWNNGLGYAALQRVVDDES